MRPVRVVRVFTQSRPEAELNQLRDRSLVLLPFRSAPRPAEETHDVGVWRPGRQQARVRPGTRPGQSATTTFGGLQVPLPGGRIDGGSVFGQYRRMAMNIGPSGAGSQLDSLSLPGESFWT